MIIVNLFGVPGAGKSTGAAYIFSQLKMKGINAELITEFAKDKVWENNEKVFKNQLYLFGKQSFRISRVQDEVDVIITDSPLLLSIFYNKTPILGEHFNYVVYDVFNSYNNIEDVFKTHDVILAKPYLHDRYNEMKMARTLDMEDEVIFLKVFKRSYKYNRSKLLTLS